MKFIWTSFGIMSPPRVDNRYIYAANEQGDTRKMSKIKYPEFSVVAQKCAFLVGYPTIIRTSQNSSTWAINEWFSDITLKDHTSDVWLSGKNNSNHFPQRRRRRIVRGNSKSKMIKASKGSGL